MPFRCFQEIKLKHDIAAYRLSFSSVCTNRIYFDTIRIHIYQQEKIVPPEAKIHTPREFVISNLLLMTSWNENVFCMWIVDVSLMFARTSCWTNTRVAGEMGFNISCLWFIYFSRPTSTWNSVEIFYWVFAGAQPPCSPKPTRMVINTLRAERWRLTFCRHFPWIFLK